MIETLLACLLLTLCVCVGACISLVVVMVVWKWYVTRIVLLEINKVLIQKRTDVNYRMSLYD